MKRILMHPLLGEVTLSQTRRARRIAVTVRPPARITLSFPPGCSRRRALAFLEEKITWVRTALDRTAENHPQRPLTEGFATRCHRLVFRPTDTYRLGFRIDEAQTMVYYPAGEDPASEVIQQTARKAVTETLRAEAKTMLPGLTAALAARHGLRYRSVTVRATHSKWGSCSWCNDISLSVYLMRLPDRLIEYVIVHELCHTVHKNHSAAFHALVDRLLAGREKVLAAELRRYRPAPEAFPIPAKEDTRS